MADEQYPKSALDKFRQWHFWWLVVFSFLLIIIFVYYLPTRFLQQFVTEKTGHGESEKESYGHDSGEEMMMSNEEMHKHMDEHMNEGMSMDEMMEHMMEMHDMTEHDVQDMMNEMMPAHQSLGGGGGHEHEEGTNGHEDPSTSLGRVTDNQGEDHGGVTYHEEAAVKEGLVVNFNVSPVPYYVDVPLNLDFFINMKPGNVPVLANQLQIEHEKSMHVVGLRSDLNEFFHIHPEFLADNPSIFSIKRTFNKPGFYKVWSSVKKDGVDHTFGHPELNIAGSGIREEKKVFFDRNVITSPYYIKGSGEARDYQVSLVTSNTIAKGRDIELSFDIHTLTGMEVEVEQYLGADMHLVIIKDDLKKFVHTHPMKDEHSQAPSIISVALANGEDDHSESEETKHGIGFIINFQEAGLYKVFAQFRSQGINLPSDEALTAEFWLQVEEKAPFPILQWWRLLLVSVLLIAGLSWAVNKYLKVKPEDIMVKK